MSLSDPSIPNGRHIHLDPGYIPLSPESAPVLIARDDSIDATGD
ncbi:hypothetical protein [Kribbella sp. CA-294648]